MTSHVYDDVTFYLAQHSSDVIIWLTAYSYLYKYRVLYVFKSNECLTEFDVDKTMYKDNLLEKFDN